MPDLRALARLLQRGSLYGLLFLIPFSKAAVEIAFGLMLAGWMLEHAPARWRHSFWRTAPSRTVLAAVCAYLIVCALSFCVSGFPHLSLRGFIGKTLEYALLYLIAVDVAYTSPAIIVRCGVLISLSAAIVCVDTIAQGVWGTDLLLGRLLSKYGRITGPYESPSDLGTYLMVVIPIVLYQIFQRRGVWRWMTGGLLATLLTGLVWTETKGAWLGFLAGVVIVIAADRKNRGKLLVGAMGVGLVALVVLVGSGRLSRVSRMAGLGFNDRVVMWQSAWKMIQDRPVLGHGVNTFMANYLEYWVGGERQPRYAHNCYLQLTAETGVLGLAAFVWLLGAIGRIWAKTRQAWMADGPARALVLGGIAGLVSFLVQAGFDTNFYSLRQVAFFWALAGMVTGLAGRSASAALAR